MCLKAATEDTKKMFICQKKKVITTAYPQVEPLESKSTGGQRLVQPPARSSISTAGCFCWRPFFPHKVFKQRNNLWDPSEQTPRRPCKTPCHHVCDLLVENKELFRTSG